MKHATTLSFLGGFLLLGGCATGAYSTASKPAEAPAAEVAETPPAPSAPAGIPAPPDVAAPPAQAQVTTTGLASLVIRPGQGTDHPKPTAKVTVHYTGWTTDGKMFDSSVQRGEPATFPLNRLIAGWTEGIQLMVQGEVRRFWIPGDLAYGDPPRREGAPAGMLVFDVELISFE